VPHGATLPLTLRSLAHWPIRLLFFIIVVFFFFAFLFVRCLQSVPRCCVRRRRCRSSRQRGTGGPSHRRQRTAPEARAASGESIAIGCFSLVEHIRSNFLQMKKQSVEIKASKLKKSILILPALPNSQNYSEFEKQIAAEMQERKK
jgi:hypothetical protein